MGRLPLARLTRIAPSPNTDYNLDATQPCEVISAIDRFTLFMRFLAPPKPAAPTDPQLAASVSTGRGLFDSVGCALCHTPTLRTYEKTAVAALGAKEVNLFSNLLLHDMGRAPPRR